MGSAVLDGAGDCFLVVLSPICAQWLSHVRLFVTPWTVALQAPLSIEIFQARILEWVACPLPGDLPNPGIEPSLPHCRRILYQLSHQGAQEYCSGQPIPSPGDLPDPGTELGSPALQMDSLSDELPGKPEQCIPVCKWHNAINQPDRIKKKKRFTSIVYCLYSNSVISNLIIP